MDIDETDEGLEITGFGVSILLNPEDENHLLEVLLCRKLVSLESLYEGRLLKLEKENKKLREILYPWK